MDLIQVVAKQDESGHWYVIPKEMNVLFLTLLYDDPDENKFIETFNKYRTGGDLNLVQMYADKNSIQ